MEIVLDPNRRSEFEQLLSPTDHTEQSLIAEATSQASGTLFALDERATVMIKNLTGFQASYEVLTNRKLHIERLQLQNKLLERDLSAIEIKALPDVSQSKKTGS